MNFPLLLSLWCFFILVNYYFQVSFNLKVILYVVKIIQNTVTVLFQPGKKVKLAWEPIVAHQVGAYPGFCSMKRLGVFLLPPGWDASASPPGARLPPGIKFAGTHLYTWVERCTVRVKCLAQQNNTMSRPGLEAGPLAKETSALTMSPPRLPHRGSIMKLKVESIHTLRL